MKNTTNKIIALSGLSGVGKTCIVNELVKKTYTHHKNDIYCKRVISYTTREPRAAEINGSDYHFVSIQKFNKMEQDAEFLEYATVFGNKYGTPKLVQFDNIHIFAIDPQGAYNIQQAYPETLTIFVHPPCRQELHRRLLERNQDHSDIIQKRMSEYELYAEYASKYHFQVTNFILAETVKNISDIICAKYNFQIKS